MMTIVNMDDMINLFGVTLSQSLAYKVAGLHKLSAAAGAFATELKTQVHAFAAAHSAGEHSTQRQCVDCGISFHPSDGHNQWKTQTGQKQPTLGCYGCWTKKKDALKKKGSAAHGPWRSQTVAKARRLSAAAAKNVPPLGLSEVIAAPVSSVAATRPTAIVPVREAPRGAAPLVPVREAPLGLSTQVPSVVVAPVGQVPAVGSAAAVVAKPAVEVKTARKKSQKYQDMSMPDIEKMLASLMREHDYIVGCVELEGLVQATELNGARSYVVDKSETDGRFKTLMPLAAGGVVTHHVLAKNMRRLPQCKKLGESARAGEVMKDFMKIEPWDGS